MCLSKHYLVKCFKYYYLIRVIDAVVRVPGDTCAVNEDDCASSPCKNNATCVDGVSNYKCICASGFSDENCDIDIDECQSAPCQNNASCIDGFGSFRYWQLLVKNPWVHGFNKSRVLAHNGGTIYRVAI